MTYRRILLIVIGAVTFLQDVAAQDNWHTTMAAIGTSQTLDTSES